MSYTINCNGYPGWTMGTREEAINRLKEIIGMAVTDGKYDELDYSENKGSLEIWNGEDRTIYTVREDK
jgi:hypothetical protein